MSFSISELKELHDFTCSLARRAGAFLRDDQVRRRTIALQTREKVNSVDLVTAADEGVEKMIRYVRPHLSLILLSDIRLLYREAVLEKYPTHAVRWRLFYGERGCFTDSLV